MCFYHCGLYSA